jgi:uncharacterized membrane protein
MSQTLTTNLIHRSEGPSWRWHGQYLLPILGVYLILALYGIDQQSLWEDEYNSVWRVTASSNPIWRDGHGFLYFALLHLWIKLGASELVLRALSVLLGAVAVCLMHALGIALLKRRTAVWVSTALFATSPFFIWYSQEARYITLVLASTLLMAYAFHRVVAEKTLTWWIVYGGTTLLALFSFVTTLILPVAHGLYLLFSPDLRSLLRKWLPCTGVVLILFSLWFVNGTHFFQAIADATRNGQPVRANPDVFPFSGEFNQVRAAVIPYTFFALAAGFSLGPSPRDLLADRSLAPLLYSMSTIFALFVLYGGLFLSGWLALRRQKDVTRFLLLWIIVPVLGVFAVAKLFNVFYDVRYVAMVLPAYLFLVASGIASFSKPAVRFLLIAAVLLVHSVALANYYFDPRYAREDTRATAKFLESVARPDDLVLVVGTLSSLPHYYTGKSALVRFNMQDESDDPLGVRLRQLSAKHDRLWLVEIRPWQVDRAGSVKTELDRAYSMFEQQVFPGVFVRGYQISN